MSGGLTAAALTGTRLAGAGAGFLAQLLFARSLPPHEVGAFFVATSVAAVLGLLASQGYPALIQRFATKYHGSAALWPAFVRHVQRRGLVAATLITALLVAFAAFFPWITPETRQVVLAVSVLMPASYMFSVYPPFASARSRFALALIPELMLRPAGLLAIAALVWFFELEWTAALLVAGFAAISTLLALAQYLRIAPLLPASRVEARPALKRLWAAEALPAMAATLFVVMFGDIVVISAAPWLYRADMAAFTIAVKLAMLSAFFVQIAHQVAAPEISAAMKAGDTGRLKSALHHATLYPVLAMTAGVIGAIFGGSSFLCLYGSEYVAAAPGLVLLLAAMLVRALMGPGSIMLVLAGAQKSNAAACFTSIAVLLAANAVLVPVWGVTGACAAVFICVSFWTVVTAWLLKRNCGLRSDAAFAFPAGARPSGSAMAAG
jgi:O-antigen/teichoic acid export membrane protein